MLFIAAIGLTLTLVAVDLLDLSRRGERRGSNELR